MRTNNAPHLADYEGDEGSATAAGSVLRDLASQVRAFAMLPSRLSPQLVLHLPDRQPSQENRPRARTSLAQRDCTIKQALQATRMHSEAPFMIDGIVVNFVSDKPAVLPRCHAERTMRSGRHCGTRRECGCSSWTEWKVQLL